MTPATWSKLTNGMTGGGVDGIQWDFVTCPIAKATPLRLHAHGGSSKYWPSITVENARRRTAKVEYSDDNGSTWVSSTRNTNNFFTASKTLSSNTVYVRLTSHTGTQVTVQNVNLASGSSTKSSVNYA